VPHYRPTCSRAAIFLAQVLSCHCLLMSSFSQYFLTRRVRAPCGKVRTCLVRWSILKFIDCRATPEHGPSTNAYNKSQTNTPEHGLSTNAYNTSQTNTPEHQPTPTTHHRQTLQSTDHQPTPKTHHRQTLQSMDHQPTPITHHRQTT